MANIIPLDELGLEMRLVKLDPQECCKDGDCVVRQFFESNSVSSQPLEVEDILLNHSPKYSNNTHCLILNSNSMTFEVVSREGLQERPEFGHIVWVDVYNTIKVGIRSY